MKNRAKCRKCQSIIESFHEFDYVSCKCGEIAITGGLTRYEVSAKDYANFLRIDDLGNEIVVSVKEMPSDNGFSEDISKKTTKKEVLDMLDEYVKYIEGMPDHAKSSAATLSDLSSLTTLLISVFRAD